MVCMNYDGYLTRRNLIVIGDNKSDIKMADGYSCQTQLSIGFLNQGIEENLAAYLVWAFNFHILIYS